MPNTSFCQSSFLGGEWSKAFQGRFDRPDYRTGMNLALNVIPIGTAACVRRPGTRFIKTTRGGAAARLIKFDFEIAFPYTIEFTNGYMRFFNGPLSVKTNDETSIVSISPATPAVVTVGYPVAFGFDSRSWVNGNVVEFRGLGTYWALLQNRQFKITTLTPTTFSLADAITGAALDGSLLGTYPPSPNVPAVARVLEIATPYYSESWATLRMVQTESTAFLLNIKQKPQVLTVTRKYPPPQFAEFSLTPAAFRDGPFLDPVKGGTSLTPNALTGAVALTMVFPTYSATTAYGVGDYVVSIGINYVSQIDGNIGNLPGLNPPLPAIPPWVPANAGGNINDGQGFLVSDIGRQVRVFSEPALWAVGTTYTIGNVVAYGGLYWTALGTSTGKQPGLDLVNWTLTPSGAAVWTWGLITGFNAVIARNLAGSVAIGTMTDQGGLAAAFDGDVQQDDSTSAALYGPSEHPSTGQEILSTYIGKDFSGATAQVIRSATLYPSIQRGLFAMGISGVAGGIQTIYVCNLRASHTSPSSVSDGTLLGTSGVLQVTQTTALTIPSADQTTAWEYVWFEIYLEININLLPDVDPPQVRIAVYAAEVSFLSPTTGSSGSVNVVILGKPLLYTTPIRTWRLGVYSDTTGYPTCGTYHEGRLWLSGVVGNRVDASMSNDLQVFSPTNPDGVVASNNGLSYVFNGPDANPIFWMLPDQQGIICGTKAGEWLVQATAINQPLTPTSVQAHRVTSIGCANIEPKRTEHTIAFVQKYGRKVMEYFADVYSGKFTAPTISEKAKHLTVSNIAELAYQQELAPIVWQRRTDGVLIGTTYQRDSLVTSQGPTFAAAHQHLHGDLRSFESIVVGPSQSGTLDALMAVTSRGDANDGHIEMLTDILDETAELTDAWFLDGAIAPTSYVNDLTGDYFVINGLWPHNGKTVTVFAGGLDCGEYVVASGSVSVPYGDGLTGGTADGLFTADFVATFDDQEMPLVVGFTFTSRGQILRPVTQVESGTQFGPGFGKVRRSQQFAALLSLTQGISFGTDFAKMRPALFKSNGGTPYLKNQLFSGTYWSTLEDDYSLDSMLCWEITRPYPATVCTLGPFLATQDR